MIVTCVTMTDNYSGHQGGIDIIKQIKSFGWLVDMPVASYIIPETLPTGWNIYIFITRQFRCE
jgi:hypothetical protein